MDKLNKKGELTTQQLVTIIVLIISFVVLLFLIFRLNLGETTTKEICHNSVAMMGQNIFKTGSLDCKTSYVCISGGGKCEDFNPSTTIDIDMKQEEPEVENDIMEAVAEEMADCWWMFGEGKVNYVGEIDLSKVTGKKACALCSIIAFDKEIQVFSEENTEEKTVGSFYEFLRTNEREKGKSYLYYLTNSNTYDENNPAYSKNFDRSIQYVIITGVSEQGALKSIGNFLLGSIDDFNDVFFSWVDRYIVEIPNIKSGEKYGHIPVSIIPKSNLGNLECGEFITKA